ncbi:uncharacterized protein PAC_04981 [Phialocephala subalpina]|uniref:J domain-containing protein n=1 Tax=Phialocephala subalpina TaxID=576137 RepID=A0A1L7WQQ4_9HELO|nr:uncharacterized protein PAC_04981 [Phialocephala subalpina]
MKNFDPTINIYELFQLPLNCTPTIKKQYQKLALIHHSDKNPQNPAATAEFQKIVAAYEILSNESRRQERDEVWTRHLFYGSRKSDKGKERGVCREGTYKHADGTSSYYQPPPRETWDWPEDWNWTSAKRPAKREGKKESRVEEKLVDGYTQEEWAEWEREQEQYCEGLEGQAEKEVESLGS